MNKKYNTTPMSGRRNKDSRLKEEWKARTNYWKQKAKKYGLSFVSTARKI